MRRFRAVILDMDGTLVDSSEAHLKAWAMAAEVLGVEVSEARIRSEFGKSSIDMAKAFLPRSRMSDASKFARLKDRIFMERCLGLVKPIAGALEVLMRFREMGLRSAVASSNPRMLIVEVLSRTGLMPYVDVVVGSEDVERGKPHPDMVAEAVRRLGVKPCEAVYVGDTVYDIEAGRAAGVFTVAVLTGDSSRDELENAGPCMVLEDLKALLRFLRGCLNHR